MIQWVGCGVGYVRLLGFLFLFIFIFLKIFLLLANLGFFREPSKRERVIFLDRGFFCFVYPLS